MGPTPAHCIGQLAGLRHAVPPFIPFRQQGPAGRRLDRIRLVVIRGQLCYVLSSVAISEFRQAVCTWSAPEAQQVDIELEKLTAQRAEALAGTRRAGDGFAAFSASKCEALLSVQIRQLRREGGAA